MEHLVLLHYPESEWGTDVVKFKFDCVVGVCDLENELSFAQSELSDQAFDAAQDYAEAVCDRVAQALGGEWKYMSYTCEIDINY